MELLMFAQFYSNQLSNGAFSIFLGILISIKKGYY